MARQPRINPLTDSAREAAREHINGFEQGMNRFNEVGAEQLREGDPRVINEIRQGRRDIRDARENLGFEEE
ncbi:hypothetical protein IG611_16515 [Pectobacterium sp. A535-S3-A17]|uniref:hypothetical protein n=1 Tax=Pectobacterium quasiaquaticum TaxID=2774015 RepID=UPI0018772B0C|nr:hypothetical protein [Pectobacterium quasiaquaticum]MBE5215996.1 hypothetical protein [Pectobacterium quasiaquaticum]MBE5226947.1 hypothetical protein [Pectobacterium quasiaquaticum]